MQTQPITICIYFLEILKLLTFLFVVKENFEGSQETIVLIWQSSDWKMLNEKWWPLFRVEQNQNITHAIKVLVPTLSIKFGWNKQIMGKKAEKAPI